MHGGQEVQDAFQLSASAVTSIGQGAVYTRDDKAEKWVRLSWDMTRNALSHRNES